MHPFMTLIYYNSFEIKNQALFQIFLIFFLRGTEKRKRGRISDCKVYIDMVYSKKHERVQTGKKHGPAREFCCNLPKEKATGGTAA